MSRVGDVRARVEALVPALAGRMQNAAQFAQLVDNNRLPQVTPAGFALPGAMVGGDADVAAGMFRQAVDETVIIVLVVRGARDATGAGAADEIAPLVSAIIHAVAGWSPVDAPGVFVLGRAELVGGQDAALVYQIDFTLSDQLRIVP